MEAPKRRVSQACDACKLRKVKCNGQQRCQQCNHLDLKCVYSSAKTKQRTQRRRGRVISQYKAATGDVISPTAPLRPAIASPPEEPRRASLSSTGSSQLHYNAPFFESLIPDYIESVYPVNPIITAAEVQESINKMYTDKEHYAFVFAFGAVTLNLTFTGPRHTPDLSRKITQMITTAVESRGAFMFEETITLRKIMVSMFLHNCLMTLRKLDPAFFYMRDAISMIQLLRVDDEEEMAKFDVYERSKRQRLYWESFIHERYLGILDYRQAILPPLKDLPERDDSLPPGIFDGFNQIIKLFRLVDGDFLRNWLDSHNSSTLTPTWIENKYKELDENRDGTAQEISMLNEMQQADLLITRHWMRTLIWRMAMSRTLLSSGSSKECLSLLFPVRLSQQLRQLISNMSREAIEIHGSGIVQKLFELTDTIADVVIHVPAATLEETAARLDDFLFLLRLIFTFPRLDSLRQQILRKKLETLQDMFPHMVNSETNSPSFPPAAIQRASSNDPWLYEAKSMVSNRSGTGMSIPAILVQDPGPDENPPPLSAPVNGGFSGPEQLWSDVTRRLSLTELSYA